MENTCQFLSPHSTKDPLQKLSRKLLEKHLKKLLNCVCGGGVVIPCILDVRFVDVPVGVTQDEGHTGFLIHLPSAVLALIFLARSQPFLSLFDCEVEFCVLTI